jgi:hypothetical protein
MAAQLQPLTQVGLSGVSPSRAFGDTHPKGETYGLSQDMRGAVSPTTLCRDKQTETSTLFQTTSLGTLGNLRCVVSLSDAADSIYWPEDGGQKTKEL